MRFGSLLAVGALLALGGCYKNTIVTGATASSSTHKEKANFFIYGLIGEHDVDVAGICPNGVAWMQSRMDVGDCLLSCITFSLYTPLTVEVKCSSGSAYLLEPDEESGVTWVTPVEPDTLTPPSPVVAQEVL